MADTNNHLGREKINFASLVNKSSVQISNPNATATRFSVTRDSIITAINTKNVLNLRKISSYFWTASGEYRRLVSYMANILTFDHVLIPRVPEEVLGQPAFKTALEEAELYLQNSAVKQTSYEIALALVRDGAYYGYEREVQGKYIFQPLDPNFCRSHYKINNNYAIEFDLSFFDNDRDGTLLAAFPKEFTKMRNAYLSDRQNMRWQMLDPKYSRAHILQDGTPLFIAVFVELLELEDYKAIEKKKSRLATYKPIIQKLPTDADGIVTVLIEEGQELHDNFLKMINNEDVDVITTPCEVDSIDLWDSKETIADEIEKAKNVIYSTAGTPLVLFNAGSKSSSVGLKASMQVDEALLFPILAQFEDWFTARLEQISTTFRFALHFPQYTIFNRDEKFKLFKDGATAGFPTKILAMAALGISPSDGNYLLNFENVYLKLTERMVPTQSSNTMATDGEDGAPTKDESQLSDEGLKTRDGDKNAKTKGE